MEPIQTGPKKGSKKFAKYMQTFADSKDLLLSLPHSKKEAL